MQSNLFTIILAHYNQLEYYKTALDSIFNQNYKNIEIIFADDCSYGINQQEIIDYIEKNKGSNIKNYIIQINEKNIGTTRNFNDAIKKASGEFVLFFAADDALCDKNTISHYVNEFEEQKDVSAIFFQTYMYDCDLKKIQNEFVDEQSGMQFNAMTSREQYETLATNCVIPMGSTAFRKECFENYGMFNESYKIIEDWSYFLNVTRNGGKFFFVNHDGLKHRDGGVSHYVGNDYPPHVLSYQNDTLLIIENEILPYIKDVSISKQNEILNFYESLRDGYKNIANNNFRIKRIQLVKLCSKVYTYRAFAKLRNYCKKSRDVFIVTFFLWMVLTIVSVVYQRYPGDINSEYVNLYYILCNIIFSVALIGSLVLYIIAKIANVCYKVFEHKFV